MNKYATWVNDFKLVELLPLINTVLFRYRVLEILLHFVYLGYFAYGLKWLTLLDLCYFINLCPKRDHGENCCPLVAKSTAFPRMRTISLIIRNNHKIWDYIFLDEKRLLN